MLSLISLSSLSSLSLSFLFLIPALHSQGSDPTSTGWDHFTGKVERKKENDGPVTRWNDGGIKLVGKKASSRHRRPAPIGFNICVDDDVAQEQEQQKNDIKKSAWQRGANSTTSLRRRLEGPGRTAEEREARDLFNDPLKNFHDDAKISAEMKKEGGALGPPREKNVEKKQQQQKKGGRREGEETSVEPAMAPPPAPTSSTTSVIMAAAPIVKSKSSHSSGGSFSSTNNKGYHDSLLLSDDKVEMSFEERRAQAMLRKREKRKHHSATMVPPPSSAVLPIVVVATKSNSDGSMSITKPTRVRRALGSAGTNSRANKKDNFLKQTKKTSNRRTTLAFGKIHAIQNQLNEDYSDSEEEEEEEEEIHTVDPDADTLSTSVLPLNESVTRKSLTFSNCSSHAGSAVSSAADTRSGAARQQLAQGTPASNILMTANATRKLMFSTIGKMTPVENLGQQQSHGKNKDSSKRRNAIAPMTALSGNDFNDSSDDSSDDDNYAEQQQQGEKKQRKMKSGKNVIGLNNDDMTMNLQAAMDDLGDMFCSPGFNVSNNDFADDSKQEEEQQEEKQQQQQPSQVTKSIFSIFQEEEEEENLTENDENAENCGPAPTIPHQRRTLGSVKPTSILRSMEKSEYKSVAPLDDDDSDDSEDDEVSFATAVLLQQQHGGGSSSSSSSSSSSAAAGTTTGGFGIYEDTVALNVFQEVSEEDTMNIVSFMPSRAAEERRNTLDMLGELDSLDMTNMDQTETLQQPQERRTTTDLMGDFSDSDEDSMEERQKQQEQRRRRQKAPPAATATATATAATMFSIFDDVFEEHEDIQKDRRATLLGDRLDGISEGEESSGHSRSTTSSKSCESREETREEEEEQESGGRRSSMDSLQGVGDLSSICCEEDDDISRRWSNGSMLSVQLPSSRKPSSNSLGFSIFTE